MNTKFLSTVSKRVPAVNKTHVKWWMPLTDELKHGIAELIDMITEDRVTFEIAKLLRDKGFPQNIEHDAWYVVKEFSTGCHWNSCTYKVGDITREYDEKCCIVMPTLQMAMKWLREVHNIAIETEWEHLWYTYIKPMTSKSSDEDYYQCESSKYEEACEAAIKYCLENLI